jgi:hypothetical protein
MKWLIVVAPVALAGCNMFGGDGKYPEQVKTNFVNACVGGGAPKSVCDCMMAKLEKDVPFSKFMEQDTKARNGGQPDPDFQKTMQDAALTCVKGGAT